MFEHVLRLSPSFHDENKAGTTLYRINNQAGSNLFGNALEAPIGTRPAMPARRPPYNRTFPCYKNQLPDVNGAAVGAGP